PSGAESWDSGRERVGREGGNVARFLSHETAHTEFNAKAARSSPSSRHFPGWICLIGRFLIILPKLRWDCSGNSVFCVSEHRRGSRDWLPRFFCIHAPQNWVRSSGLGLRPSHLTHACAAKLGSFAQFCPRCARRRSPRT